MLASTPSQRRLRLQKRREELLKRTDFDGDVVDVVVDNGSRSVTTEEPSSNDEGKASPHRASSSHRQKRRMKRDNSSRSRSKRAGVWLRGLCLT
jgi:hypothetical protein